MCMTQDVYNCLEQARDVYHRQNCTPTSGRNRPGNPSFPAVNPDHPGFGYLSALAFPEYKRPSCSDVQLPPRFSPLFFPYTCQYQSTTMSQIPSFDNLTLDPAGPPGNAWGLFGRDNDLGMLNLLTPETVRRAASDEIRDGVRFSLDLPLDHIKSPSFGRKAFAREFVNRAPRSVNDDVLIFNTQTSSQWDGFRHYGELRQYLL